MTLTVPLDDMVVARWGSRPAVRAAAGLLAQAGARVVAFGSPSPGDPLDAFGHFEPDTPQARDAALAGANVVLFSSDRTDPPLPELRPDVIACDITVGAGNGEWSEPLLQAASGISDITGARGGGPVICDAPVIEFQTAIFAAAGVLAAWPRRVATGAGQAVGVSLIDCALNGLSSFLPLVFAGKAPRRSGNRHPMAVPWNAYRASDGWILLCSATDEHWVRLCALMGRDDLATGRFGKLADRVEQCDAVDAVVEDWTRTLGVKACVEALGAAGLAAGPVLTLDDLHSDANLRHRSTIAEAPVSMPRSFVKANFAAVPTRRASRSAPVGAMPLSGLRVLEIGQYTTAPLAAKQLALMGAEVIKIEPPGGEASRAWPPHQDGQGYFFTLNNANKRSCMLDLRTAADKATFRGLVEKADVLVENLKPGSLGRLGFGPQELAALNPGLVYCAISGFGQVSAYPGRPAFDTVVQAMSGLMDLTRAGGEPVKLGISAADITGGIAGLFAILCGLEQRRRTGRGLMLDLSMQDVGVWLTQTAWRPQGRAPHAVLACADGHVVAACDAAAVADLSEAMTRAEAVSALAARGIPATGVRTLVEIAQDPAVVGEGAVAMFTGADGRTWPLFRSPYRFSAEATCPLEPVGPLGEANADVARLLARVS